MRSLNIVALLVVSSLALACGSSTPPAETPEPAAEAEAPADAPPAPKADAGAAAPQ